MPPKPKAAPPAKPPKEAAPPDDHQDEEAAIVHDKPIREGSLRVFCNAKRNFAPVIMDEKTGQTSLQDAGGFRIAVKCGKFQAVFYNKKATEEIDAVWFSRLKAVECMKEWFPQAKHFYVCDDKAELKTTNRSSPSVRYRYIADQHAQSGGFEYEHLRVKPKENIAKDANVPNAPHFYTALAKEQLASKAGGAPNQTVSHAAEPASSTSPKGAAEEIARLLLNKDFAADLLELIRKSEGVHENAGPLAEALESYVAEPQVETPPGAGEPSPKRSARV